MPREQRHIGLPRSNSHSAPRPHGLGSQAFLGGVHPLRPSPWYPKGHLHVALWLVTSQIAYGPHRQGDWHFPLTQASFEEHSESARQPSTWWHSTLAFPTKPSTQVHWIPWLTGVQSAFSPQDPSMQGFMQRRFKRSQSLSGGQSALYWHTFELGSTTRTIWQVLMATDD